MNFRELPEGRLGMNINEFREKVILSLYGELDDRQEMDLTRLLEANPQYITEFRQLVRTHSLAGQARISVNEELASAARSRLSGIYEEEGSLVGNTGELMQDAPEGLIRRTSDFLLPAGTGGWAKCAASLAAGLVIGLVFLGNSTPTVFESVPDLARLDEDSFITDVRFTPGSEDSGDVELSFSLTRNYSFTDSIDNPKVQRLLAYSLVRESNPGERIRTVRLLRNNAGKNDQEIKRALLTAVVTDENPVVRGQALSALEKYRSDKEVQSTLINVLRFDENSRMRIEAIRMLSDLIIPGMNLPTEDIDAMKKQVEVEDNLFMKNQLNNILEKVSLEQL